MSTEYDRRATVITCLRAGRTPKEIIDFTLISKTTVYRIAAEFRAAGDHEEDSVSPLRKKHDRTECRKRDSGFIRRLQELVDSDPSTSIRSLAAQLNVGHQTIISCIREDLRYHSYALKVRQLLTEPMKAKRLAKCSLLLSSLKHEASGRLRFFSDEKIFTVDASFNRRNDRWLAQDPADVPIVMTTNHPASVHVLLVVSSEGDVMPPHFLPRGRPSPARSIWMFYSQWCIHGWLECLLGGHTCSSKTVHQHTTAAWFKTGVMRTWICSGPKTSGRRHHQT